MADKDRRMPLRTPAEAELARALPNAPTPPPTPSTAHPLHERQVHQIELEMQSDALRQSQVALEAARARYLDLYEFAPVGYLTLTPSGQISEANLTAAVLLGVDRMALRQTRFEHSVQVADRERWQRMFSAAMADGAKTACEVELERRGSTPGPNVHVDIVRGTAEDGKTFLRVTLTDITERKLLEDEVRQLAFYDECTKLPNRRLFHDRLGQAMVASKRSGRYGAVLGLDLDDFKGLNDTHGHPAGDLLLVEVADRLRHCVRETDTIARFGGDEFLVVLRNLAVRESPSVALAGIVVEKIRVALDEPYTLTIKQEGAPDTTVAYQCSASIGVALFRGTKSGQDEIIGRADVAMYQAKQMGRKAIRFYRPEV